MSKKIVKETLNEFGGAGFSYGGGSSMFRANRGRGFGGGSNLGGPNMMYTYEIVPLNKTLQPDVYGEEGSECVKIGSDISGYELNKKDGKLHAGSVLQIVKSNNGSLKYYIILDPDTSIKMKIDPTTANLISKLDGIDPIQGDQLLNKEDSEILKGELMGDIKAKPKKLKPKIVRESLLESTNNYETGYENYEDNLLIKKYIDMYHRRYELSFKGAQNLNDIEKELNKRNINLSSIGIEKNPWE